MEVKECSKCHQILPLDNFRWKNKSLNKKHSQCKQCQSLADKKHYAESEKRRKAVRQLTDLQKQSNIEFIEFKKQQGCQKCGEKRFYVLDFHHKNPNEKVNEIAHMIKSSSIDNLEKEINKCVLLCANCHREWHYLEKNNSELTIEKYLKS